MTRWDWKSILAFPLGTSAYSESQLRNRAERVRGSNYSSILTAIADRVGANEITPYEAMIYLHARQREMGIR